ncbi:FMN-dependent dehydrogenase-domain-containing protein [Diplogelasinospora grovesii]|uniref:FMN-dependent dehydrogenase-domain-containing protein n=1 Tax=Diplogelasinospora grovesii TaxID=303347 RepID=A0AAN6NAK1_9PEZI|nr:FMN-dependent dehydrogenase-domain-containing protein [Diplogelasinospora grovesii]
MLISHIIFKMGVISATELSRHTTADDLWLVVSRTVYDLTDFAPSHPGGLDILLRYAGQDATEAYNRAHSPSLITTSLSDSKIMGRIDPSTPLPAPSDMSPPVQDVSEKPPLESMISTHDFADSAAISFPRKTYAFVSSAATDLYTHRANTSTYSLIGLRPRVLTDVSRIDINTTILGHDVKSPIFVSPTSLGKLVHPEGEKEIARACKSLGIAQVVSTSASFPIHEIAASINQASLSSPSASSSPLPSSSTLSTAAPSTTQNGADITQYQNPDDIPLFFQLYVDKARTKSESLLRAAVQSSGVAAVFLTVDAPVPGKREADERVRADESISVPMSGARAGNDRSGGGLGRVMGKYIDDSIDWSAVAWLRRTVPGVPIILKGVQTSADAVKALDHGVDGIMISNHGGRSLDTAPPTILVLLELQRVCPQVFDEMEVYIDGGVMRGTDVFKALCLGATGVGIGRGALYGLNYGAPGIERYVEILNDELQTTMKMCGVTRIDQLHPGLLNTRAVDHLIPERVEDDDGHPYAKWRRSSSKL